MKREKLYGKNLALFAQTCPLEAYRLEVIDCKGFAFCYTHEGELNLMQRQDNSSLLYFHAPQGALWEAERWKASLTLDDTEVVYIYGIGLGYYYVVMKEWLASNRKRHLIFIESDPCVVKCFLETKLATEILNHKRVHVWLLTALQETIFTDERDFINFQKQIASKIEAFGHLKSRIFALQLYFQSRFQFFDQFYFQLCTNIFYAKLALEERKEEKISLSIDNFYHNIFYISQSLSFLKLSDYLAGLPAIICGAGPSVAKQLPLLKKLKNKAIIVSAGSATNALGHAQVIPHLTGGLDPYPIQEDMLLRHSAADVPLLYTHHYYWKALQKWRGPLIYVTTARGKSLTGEKSLIDWFEDRLKVDKNEKLSEGYSTSNFLLNAFCFIGTNPVILIGMDLAYTNQKRYAPGVSSEKHVVNRNALFLEGFNGKSIETNMLWCLEASAIMKLQEKNPQLSIYNATEGGLNISTIPNVKFEEVTEDLVDFGDIEGWIHGNIQNTSSNFDINVEHVKKIAAEELSSLEKCLSYLKFLQMDLDYNKHRIQNGEKLLYGPYTGKASLWLAELESEVMYMHLIRHLEYEFDARNRLYLNTLKDRFSKSCQRLIKELNYLMKRYVHVLKRLQKHFDSLSKAYSNHLMQKQPLASPFEQQDLFLASTYLKNGKLKIDEPSLDLNIDINFTPPLIPKEYWPTGNGQSEVIGLQGRIGEVNEGQTLYFYPNGKLKVESFFKQGQLHGPWSFYSNTGVLLVKSWFIEGQKQGKACYFDLTGLLCYVKYFLNDEEIARINFKTECVERLPSMFKFRVSTT